MNVGKLNSTIASVKSLDGQCSAFLGGDYAKMTRTQVAVRITFRFVKGQMGRFHSVNHDYCQDHRYTISKIFRQGNAAQDIRCHMILMPLLIEHSKVRVWQHSRLRSAK